MTKLKEKFLQDPNWSEIMAQFKKVENNEKTFITTNILIYRN